MSNVHELQRPEQRLGMGESFEDFWFWCPKKVGKLLTQMKWDAITGPGLSTRIKDNSSGTFVEVPCLKATPVELVAGMKRYYHTQVDSNNGYRLKEGGKYTCHPATWLNQGRWMDYE